MFFLFLFFWCGSLSHFSFCRGTRNCKQKTRVLRTSIQPYQNLFASGLRPPLQLGLGTIDIHIYARYSCLVHTRVQLLYSHLPKRSHQRGNAENSLLEIQLEKLLTWLPVCYERWNSSLGTLVCRQLGYLRLSKHKGVNLTDIGPNYTDGFVQITSEHQSNLESLWRFRLPQVSSWVVYAGFVTSNSAKLAQYQGLAVEKIIYNKNYNHRTHDNDIALVKLRAPLNFSDTIRPVCLPQYDYDLPGGTQCWISGWGYTQPDDAPVPLISTKKCNSSCMYNGEITPRMLCAGYTEGKVDACQGDSGGPLVCQDENVWRLVGVVSWGTGCAEPNHPGVYTKVAEFLEWIYEIIEVSK
uniref:Transmembrane serine protease 5 n=1 Tax=Cyprinus carpio carpio TaxID=630221 RepID=A0A9J7ZT78_CYPCA